MIDMKKLSQLIARAVADGTKSAYVEMGLWERESDKPAKAEKPAREESDDIDDDEEEEETPKEKKARKARERRANEKKAKEAASKKDDEDDDIDDDDEDDDIDDDDEDEADEMSAEDFMDKVKKLAKGDFQGAKKFLKKNFKVGKFSALDSSKYESFLKKFKNA